MRVLIFTCLKITFLTFTLAQGEVNCTLAQNFFESFVGECKSSISTQNCVHLDVTDSYDFEGKEFLFKWEMGDGNSLDGMEVNHCYELPGNYTATLTLFDPVTKALLKEEAKVNITIKGEFELTINSAGTLEVGKQVTFNYELKFPESLYQVENVYWYFGDGTFSCEKEPAHTYSSVGSFKTNLLITLSSGSNTEVLCISDTFQVKLSDPSEGILSQLFDATKMESRFLADEVHYKIITKQSNRFIEIVDHDSLPGGLTYKLLAYRGDLLFSSEEIVTSDTADVANTINNSAKSLAQTVPLKFKSLSFELDENELSKKNKKVIRHNLELLKKFPMIKLLIGVYTTSTGSITKGIELSVARGNLIKSYLIENGISPNSVFVADPNDNRSLINSCVTGDSCEYVDPKMDRRVDFKILNELIK